MPESLLHEAIIEVPKSIKILAPLVDYFVELENDDGTPDIELVTEGETWENFTSKWVQYVLRAMLARLSECFLTFLLSNARACAWVPGRKKKEKLIKKSASGQVAIA